MTKLNALTENLGLFRYKWPTEEGQKEGIAERLKKCDELKDAVKTFFDDYVLEADQSFSSRSLLYNRSIESNSLN